MAEMRALPTEYRWVGEREGDEPIIGGPYPRYADAVLEAQSFLGRSATNGENATALFGILTRVSVFDAYGAVIYTKVADAPTDLHRVAREINAEAQRLGMIGNRPTTAA